MDQILEKARSGYGLPEYVSEPSTLETDSSFQDDQQLIEHISNTVPFLWNSDFAQINSPETSSTLAQLEEIITDKGEPKMKTQSSLPKTPSQQQPARSRPVHAAQPPTFKPRTRRNIRSYPNQKNYGPTEVLKYMPNEAARILADNNRICHAYLLLEEKPNQDLLNFLYQKQTDKLNPIELAGCIKLLQDHYDEKRGLPIESDYIEPPEPVEVLTIFRLM